MKFGADPSRPDLHLGHTVPLRVLKLLQDMGHEIVFVIGDFTAMIGDPSGKSKTRPQLTFEETRKSRETYFKQATKILDKDKTKITYNSEWLNQMNFKDVLELTGKYTVARILERDDFNNRFINKIPIGIHEFMYPLMQGYDSDEEPFIMFEKAMKIPDECLECYFQLTTDINKEVYQKWIKEDIVNAHKEFGKEIIRMYHGESFIAEAVEKYNAIAKGAIPDNIEQFCVDKTDLEFPIVDLLVKTALVSSKSEGRRLIEQKGIKINGELVNDVNQKLTEKNILDNEIILQKGKNKFIKVCFK